jgi:DNA polymerase II small subunit/DNA polymerase delta subunit B
MPFGLDKQKDLAVLEGKFQIYEDLSKEMLDKLERAVEKISEGNQKVALILAKHEEKIEQGIRADELIVKMVEEMRESNSKEHAAVIERIEKVENRVVELIKFRWMVVGVSMAAVIILGSAEFFGSILTMPQRDANIQESIDLVK